MKSLKIDMPASIRLAAEAVNQRSERKKRSDEIKRKRYEKKEKIEARDRQKKGFRYAKKLLRWVHAFIESEDGRKLLKASRYHLYIFDEDLPGVAWKAIGVSEGGLWWMRNGCGAKPEFCNTPEDLADEVDSKILKEACAWTDSGKVWECIERRTKEPNWYRL